MFIPYYLSSEVDRHFSCFKEQYLKEDGYSIKIKNSYRNNLLTFNIKNYKEITNEHKGGQYVKAMIKFKRNNSEELYCVDLQRGNSLFTTEDKVFEFSKRYVKYLNILIHEAIINEDYKPLKGNNKEKLDKQDLFYIQMNFE